MHGPQHKCEHHKLTAPAYLFDPSDEKGARRRNDAPEGRDMEHQTVGVLDLDPAEH